MSAGGVLRDARCKRVTVVAPSAVALELQLPTGERGVLLCSAERDARGLGWLREQRPSRAGAPQLNAFERALKAALHGARLEQLEHVGASSVWLGFLHGGERAWLALSFRGHGGIALCGADRTLKIAIGSSGGFAHEGAQPYEPAQTLLELATDGEALADALDQALLAHARALAERALRDACKRRQRRLAAIEADRARSAEIQPLRAQASLLLCHLHEIARSANEVALLDDSVEPAIVRTLTLDPALGPKKQAEAWFARARKLERGVAIAAEREAATRAEIDALGELERRAQRAQSRAELQALAQEARGYSVTLLSEHRPARGRPSRARFPYREFRGVRGRLIWVGRGAAENDALTLHHARPHDLWLHARDTSGAHVIVPLERGESCPPDLLCDAATLAAHFSSARDHVRVDVSHIERRYVQKPRKSPPGLVRLVRERVLHLALEPARLARLLAAEQLPDEQPPDER